LTLIVRVKPRAERQIEAADSWRSDNGPAAPGAVRSDLKAALEALVEKPGIGTLVENARDSETRHLYLARADYFAYYRPRGRFLDVVALWHAARGQGRSL